MERTTKRALAADLGALAICLLLGTFASAQTPPEEKPLTAGQFFKHVTVLGALPVNEFMSTMGFFSASLGYSCENCHGADSGPENFAAEDREKKQIARRMIIMVAAMNKQYFNGKPVLTCYTCHRGGNQPKQTPNLAALYSPPPEEPNDIIDEAPRGASVDQIFDKYLQGLGGSQRLTGITSFVAKGTSVGYGVDATKQPIEILVKAPAQRKTIVHTPVGDNTTTFDGHDGWIAGEQIAGPEITVPVLALSGGDLEGLKLEAQLSFPAGIQQALEHWHAGYPTEIDDHEVQVVQGTTAAGNIATLYFDSKSGLLLRLLRYTNSAVGRFPTQIDYSDYRDVSGVKMPFRWTVVWLDGRETIELTEIRPNVPINSAEFGKPAAPVKSSSP